MKNVEQMFTPRDRELIAEAVRAAEAKTGGEVVPFVVARSDQYEEAEWRAGFLFGLASLITLYAVRGLTSEWSPPGLLEAGLAALLGTIVGLACTRLLPSFKMFLAGRSVITRRVEQRAAEAFIREEVFRTRDRTGVLIFLSLLERKVLVVGDTGINAKVTKEDWTDVVRRVVVGIRHGKPAEGLIDAIRQCGVLLERRGVQRRSDDRDELADSLRIGDG